MRLYLYKLVPGVPRPGPVRMRLIFACLKGGWGTHRHTESRSTGGPHRARAAHPATPGRPRPATARCARAKAWERCPRKPRRVFPSPCPASPIPRPFSQE